MKTLDHDICQSCGMPIKKVTDFGTYEDGSYNSNYCHFCFKDGKFTDAGISLEDKIAKNIQIAIKRGMPERKAHNLATTILPTLKRWQK
ncbi:zinc ribbon domain-containing protein [Maribacter sp. CXY002]|uniref:zinc ribbon domain-containing protein n=1 Tax=Maribacter luteocoastalis TaxID=3407671 RepID=UPI003B674868